MKALRWFMTLTILGIAFSAALYTQRVEVVEWYRELTEPTLPEAVGWEEVGEEVGEVDEVGEVEEVDQVEEVDEVDQVGEVEEEVGEEVEESTQTESEETVELEDSQQDDKVEALTSLATSLNLAVPFTPQAPHANWDLPYKEACEEASLLMVHAFFQGAPEGLMNADDADIDILSITAFENETFGFYEDTTVEQLGLIAELMYGYNVEILEDPSVEEIQQQLNNGHPVIVPAAGRLLGNPYFTAPGPIYHMLVIRGYTQDQQFIVNDPGTYRGEAYLYDFDTLMNAMHDWNQGREITEGRKAVLILTP